MQNRSRSRFTRFALLSSACCAVLAAVAPACDNSGRRDVFGDGTEAGVDEPGSSDNPIADSGPGLVQNDAATGCKLFQCDVVDCGETGPTTTVTGKVYEPAGKIPLYNVIVYVPNTNELPPVVQGATCDRCGTLAVDPVTSALTKIDGSFELKDVPVGDDVPIVVQVGKWRKQIHMKVEACKENPIEEKLTLPKNQQEGSMPRIAVNVGSEDPLASLLSRIGIDDAEFTAPGGTGAVQIFRGDGFSGGLFGSLPQVQGEDAPKAKDALYDSTEHLSQYDLVLLACESAPYNEGGFPAGSKTPEHKEHMRDYLNAGGRVFATHYHATWFKDGPEDMQSVASWGGTGSATDTHGDFSIDRSFAKGEAFGDWLELNGASSNGEDISLDEFGDSVNAANEKSQQWIYNDDSNPVKYLTFNTPVDVDAEQQCGRGVISDVHVGTGGGDDLDVPGGCSNAALSDQEKALLFLLMDLSSCVQDDGVDPTPPH